MNHDENGVKATAPVHQIVIVMNEGTGHFGVQGIPLNKVTALGMLRLAEHVVMRQDEAPKSAIIKPPPGVRLG